MKFRTAVLIAGMKKLAATKPSLRPYIANLFLKARFPDGEKMTVEEVADYLEEGGNPEAAEAWKENHNKYKDVVKDLAAKQASLRKINRALKGL